jgi:hypothetical protein
MQASRLDIANATIAIFLKEVGRFYDEVRDYKPFGPDEEQVHYLLGCFDSRCCYCHSPIDTTNFTLDHLVPVDKLALGLHAWGNVVPSCQACRAARQQKTWRELLLITCPGSALPQRIVSIEAFVKAHRYDPALNLHSCADSLYEDVGAIAMTLIQLRYKQAEQKVRASLGADASKVTKPGRPTKTRSPNKAGAAP